MPPEGKPGSRRRLDGEIPLFRRLLHDRISVLIYWYVVAGVCKIMSFHPNPEKTGGFPSHRGLDFLAAGVKGGSFYSLHLPEPIEIKSKQVF